VEKLGDGGALGREGRGEGYGYSEVPRRWPPSVLRTMLFWPRWQALICTGHMLGFMGPDKPSSPVTTLSNCTPCFEVVCWRENKAA
jgi:hypothetical protein